jgi:hypothetical protein
LLDDDFMRFVNSLTSRIWGSHGGE